LCSEELSAVEWARSEWLLRKYGTKEQADEKLLRRECSDGLGEQSKRQGVELRVKRLPFYQQSPSSVELANFCHCILTILTKKILVLVYLV
jgi:hypothetical protein